MGYISEIISGLFALLVTIVEVRSAQDWKRTEQRAAVRAKENRLAMKMQDANLALAVATAIAVEKGEHNGEMKAAKEKAKAAQEEYDEFIHELASEQATSL